MNDPVIAAEPVSDDLDRDAEPVAMPLTVAERADAPAVEDEAPDHEIVLEMRQVAGLTSGTVMPLHEGLFQFRESDREIGFSLAIQSADNVMVIPGSVDAVVDRTTVDRPTRLGDSVLNVGSACFTVRSPRPPSTPATIIATLEAGRRPTPAIAVPDLADDDRPAPEPAKGSFLSSLFTRPADEVGDEPTLSAAARALLQSIQRTRSIVAARHRRLHPDPEELRSRLARLEPGLWERSIDHPLFGRFAIAYCTIPWEPRFDQPEKIPEELHEAIEDMSYLPWVPVTANLLLGPLGIVGRRAASLACARHAVLSLAALTCPDDVEFSIVTSESVVDDWNWTSSLPSSLFPTGSSSYCIALADSLDHFESAGFEHEAVRNNEMGLIVLGETVEELPDYCATVLLINDDGTCQVSNHLGERIEGTPIGVTTAIAIETAERISEATSPFGGVDEG